MSKEIKEIKKINSIQARIINKIVNHETLRTYIEEDEIIFNIVEMLEFCSFKVHRNTFKKFLTDKYEIDIDNMKDHELEAAAINFYRFNNITPRTLNKKLEEMKYLKLIEYEDDNEHILATDLLITIKNKGYTRYNKSIKDESKLIMETEDKLFAYRFTIENNYITKNKDFIEQLNIYNSVYVIDKNIFILGRRGSEDLSALQRRIKKIFESNLIDKETIIEINRERTHIPIIIYVSEKMKFKIEDIKHLTDRMFNSIEIIRY